MGRSVRSLSGRLVVRIQSVTDLSRKTGSDSSTAKRSVLGVSSRVLENDHMIINGCPV